MFVCVCVCVCVHARVRMCVAVGVHMCVYVFLSVYLFLCERERVFVCVFMYRCVRISERGGVGMSQLVCHSRCVRVGEIAFCMCASVHACVRVFKSKWVGRCSSLSQCICEG